jgi:hypothetical protein
MFTRPEDFAIGPDNILYTGMFAGVVQGVLSSTDAGRSWDYLGMGGESQNAILAYDSVLVVAGDGGTYVRVGVDGDWERRNDGFVTNGTNTLVRDGGGRIYAGTWEGLYYTDDVGLYWHRDTNAVFGRTIGELRLNSRGELIASTTSGVFLSRDRGITWTFCGLGETQVYSAIFVSDDTVLVTNAGMEMYREGISVESKLSKSI